MKRSLEGGCLCGEVRYKVNGTIIDAGYCHCRLCRRASGAPVVAWLTVPVQSFSYLQGAASVFHSS
ncbi:MAG TPA: GFA family protein, partial [Thermodesulfobacteriota bacterium]|nr:GFA family protein [Thermodesulfobacteriota bacterium]